MQQLLTTSNNTLDLRRFMHFMDKMMNALFVVGPTLGFSGRCTKYRLISLFRFLLGNGLTRVEIRSAMSQHHHVSGSEVCDEPMMNNIFLSPNRPLVVLLGLQPMMLFAGFRAHSPLLGPGPRPDPGTATRLRLRANVVERNRCRPNMNDADMMPFRRFLRFYYPHGS
jgi:hypothetical protein